MKATPRVMACAVLAVSLFLGGCVTSKKYKMAKKEGALPPQALDWTASAASADLTLQSVIVFKGPGSWKREARWDEYVVTVASRGLEPLVVEKAAVVDLLGVPREWGVDPWQLEKMSYTNWDKYGKAGLTVVAGAGAIVLYGAATVSVTLGGFMAAPGSVAAAGGAAGGAVLVALPIVAVVDITAVAIMNHQNKKKIVAEFDRRRLPLPVTLAPGDSVHGSLFFPMTPGPQRLILSGRQGGQPVELVIDLKPFAGLHLKPAAEKKATLP